MLVCFSFSVGSYSFDVGLTKAQYYVDRAQARHTASEKRAAVKAAKAARAAAAAAAAAEGGDPAPEEDPDVSADDVEEPEEVTQPLPGIVMLDVEGNRLSASIDGSVKTVLARDAFNVVPDSGDKDYIPPQYYSPTTDPLPPRLFLIRRDQTGMELIVEESMTDYRAVLSLAPAGRIVTLDPQPLKTAADVLPQGTAALQFLVRQQPPTPFAFTPVAPVVVRSVFGTPVLGRGMGVPMRAEAAQRWLQLADANAPQFVQLRHVFQLPVLEAPTQATAVADRESFRRWKKEQGDKDVLFTVSDDRTAEERETEGRLQDQALVERQTRQSLLREGARSAVAQSRASSSMAGQRSTAGSPSLGTMLVPPFGAGSIGVTATKPLPEDVRDRPKLKEQVAVAAHTGDGTTPYFQDAAAQHHFEIVQLVRSLCFPSATKNTQGLAGSTQRLPVPSERQADQTVAMHHLNLLSGLKDILSLPAGALPRRLDLTKAPLGPVMDKAPKLSAAHATAFAALLGALGFDRSGDAFIRTISDAECAQAVSALSSEVARVRAGLERSSDAGGLGLKGPVRQTGAARSSSTAAVTTRAPDDDTDSDEEGNLHNRSDSNLGVTFAPFKSATVKLRPTSPGDLDETVNDGTVFESPAVDAAHQPYMRAATPSQQEAKRQQKQTLLQHQLSMARANRESTLRAQELQATALHEQHLAAQQLPGRFGETVSVDTLQARASQHKQIAQAVVDGLSLRSPLLDVYGKPRAERVQLPLEAQGLAQAEPNAAYMGHEAEVQAKQRVRTMSTMGQEKFGLTQALNHASVLTGTSLHPSQVEVQPPLATLSGPVMSAAAVAFPEFRMMPAVVDFGAVQFGCTYRIALSLVNCGAARGRFQVSAPAASPMLVRVLYRPGPVYPGISVRVEVELFAGQVGSWSEQLTVTTERSVFHVPLSAECLSTMPGMTPAPLLAASSTFDNVKSASQNANNTMASALSSTGTGVPQLGASRLVANVPSQFVHTSFAKLGRAVPAPSYTGVSFSRTGTKSTDPHDVPSGLDDMDHEEPALEHGVLPPSNAKEPSIPSDLHAKPDVSSDQTVADLKKKTAKK
jgi:hypothetical protein